MALAHIFAGLLAISAGFVALFARKGGLVHRRGGTVFAYAMVVMASAGAAMAAMQFHIGFQKLNVIVGLFTVYLVVSALLTVRRSSGPGKWDWAAMGFALAVGLLSLAIVVGSVGRAQVWWFPAVPAFVFGTVALLCALGDFRMIRAGGLQGRPRIARHLWRMCFAMFIASGSFFLGQSKVFPEALRIIPLLALPVMLVLAVMAFWWVRISFARRPLDTQEMAAQ
jgi:uncharacterized membrane protein